MIFDVLRAEERPYEFSDRVQLSLSYEMSLNLRTYDREVYNFLDWLGDIGGLYDGLRGIFMIFLSVLTYKRYDTYMVSQLYQQQAEKNEDHGDKRLSILMKGMSNYFKKEIDKEYLNPKKVTSLKMLFFNCIPKRFVSKFDNSKILRRTDQYRLFK